MSLDANNYSKLVNSGRAKAIGVPWTEAEWAEIQTVQGAERDALIAKLRGAVPSVEVPKVETTEIEGSGEITPDGEIKSTPAVEKLVEKPKKVRKVKK